jgi:hypothetical protein
MPSNAPKKVETIRTRKEQQEHVHTTNPGCFCGNTDLAMANNPEDRVFQRVYPRPAVRPAHLPPVGVPIFHEKMDAPMTNPIPRHDSAALARQPQRHGPMQMMRGFGARGMQETNKTERSCMAPVTAAVAPVTAAVFNLFLRALEAFRSRPEPSSFNVLTPSPLQQPPVELEELTNYYHPGRYDSVYARPSPPRVPPPVANLQRSNAIRRPYAPRPAHPPVARSNAVRRATRHHLLFPGTADCLLGHHPGGEADSYYLPNGTQDTADSAPPALNSWEEQRLVGGEVLSVPSPTGRAVDKPLPPLPANEPRQPLRSSHAPPRRPLLSHAATNQLPSLSTVLGLPNSEQRSGSDYLLWRNMGDNATSAATDDSLSSGYDTYATTDSTPNSDNVFDGIPEAVRTSNDRFSISDDDDAFSVGSSLHKEEGHASDTLQAALEQHRYLLSDSEDADSEGKAVRVALRVVNADSRDEVEAIVRAQAQLDSDGASIATSSPEVSPVGTSQPANSLPVTPTASESFNENDDVAADLANWASDLSDTQAHLRSAAAQWGDTTVEEQLIDQSLFADFDGGFEAPPTYDLPPAYEDVVSDARDPIVIARPIPLHPLEVNISTVHARNRAWEEYSLPQSRVDEEWVADEDELPTAERLKEAFGRVNGQEGLSVDDQDSAGKFLLLYELRIGREFCSRC